MPENWQFPTFSRARKNRWRKLSDVANHTLIFLLIEFFDKLHYGIFSAALPTIKTSLDLNYIIPGKGFENEIHDG